MDGGSVPAHWEAGEAHAHVHGPRNVRPPACKVNLRARDYRSASWGRVSPPVGTDFIAGIRSSGQSLRGSLTSSPTRRRSYAPSQALCAVSIRPSRTLPGASHSSTASSE